MSNNKKNPLLPARNFEWPIPWTAVALLAMAESLRLKAYLCPAKVWTIGWGETEGVVPGMVWTKQHADERLCQELAKYVDAVRKLCKVAPNENQLGAFVSLAYNIGLAAFKKSTVLRQYNAGNYAAAARAFALFNKATVDGKLVELPGLTSRRAAEAALFLKPTEDDEAPAHPMPQAVAAESKLAASPIAQSGAATAGAGALTLLSSVKDNAEQVSGGVSMLQEAASTASGLVSTLSSALGMTPTTLLGLAILATGLAVMYWRHEQRQQGFA